MMELNVNITSLHKNSENRRNNTLAFLVTIKTIKQVYQYKIIAPESIIKSQTDQIFEQAKQEIIKLMKAEGE